MNNITGRVGANSQSVLEAAKMVTSATANLVFATNPEEIIVSAKKSLVGISNLLNSSSTASLLSNDKQVQEKISKFARNTALKMCDLLDAKKVDPTPESINQVETASVFVTNSINELLASLKDLPDSQNLSLVHNVAELEDTIDRELSNCSSFIKNSDDTIKRESKTRKSLEDTSLDELAKAIINSSSAITNATGRLVDMAYNSNKKRREKKGQNPIDENFVNGIVEACKAVSNSIDGLQNSVRGAMNGNIDEDAIVSSSRSVTSSTAQLVAATRAKSDSETQNNLSSASKGVANAVSELVSALHRATGIIEGGGEEDLTNYEFETTSRASELQAQMKILRLERELERERKRMQKMGKVTI